MAEQRTTSAGTRREGQSPPDSASEISSRVLTIRTPERVHRPHQVRKGLQVIGLVEHPSGEHRREGQHFGGLVDHRRGYEPVEGLHDAFVDR